MRRGYRWAASSAHDAISKVLTARSSAAPVTHRHGSVISRRAVRISRSWPIVALGLKARGDFDAVNRDLA